MTVGPYVPTLSASTTSPAAMDFTAVPTAAPMPMPFQRVVVLFGLITRPKP